ncbi:MAG: bifunctional (p)ppGpp synthetase/guanosine-3',5'-bis(diphosphate) 3'-pyrophosphohydrolase [Gammaproteobacteria bacterium]|nr:MAG: bifunctional (p)ppGpp synthetase/guanosine-3',5'-bis(diphosphate) 3'-pyrophosphohydrolase [Gammaproteobacteria bacterium]
MARRAHAGQRQIDGMDMLLSLLHTADTLDRLKLDTDTLVAAILSELPGEPDYDPVRLRQDFGEAVQQMVEQVGRIRALSATSAHQDGSNVEALRRLLLDLAGDVRSLLVLLAKRLRLMRNLKQLDPALQRLIALETRRVHAPLANRLGVWQVKWELEDLCLRYLEPEQYKTLAARLEGRRSEREAFIQQVVERIQSLCREQGIEAEVMGRPKHIYSIWNKMRQKHLDFDQVMDVRAVRVLVDTVSQCYEVLGLVHGQWRPIPGEFDDYIAHPKPNGYQSLHTAVVGEDGRPLEVQVRTRQMHELAERGVAAHWRYKENNRADPELERRIAWMRAWLEQQDGAQEAPVDLPAEEEYEARRIYVLTPDGKVIELPRGATPLDFAYAIHTDVGHRCRGAKVNGRMVPLTRRLESGDRVEILTAREGGPSRDWLSPQGGYLVTARARSRIRQWFKQQDHDQHVQMGRAALEREFARLGLPKPDLERLAEHFRLKGVDELLAAVGRGDISAIQAANSQMPEPSEDVAEAAEKAILARVKERRPSPGRVSGTVVVQGVGDLMTHMAGCCKPVPPDPIVGYITRGRGITIHRQDCRVVEKMDAENRSRLVPAVWSETQQDSHFVADIQLYAQDRKGLLRDITSVFANAEIPVLGINSQSDRREETANMRITVEVDDMAQLGQVMGQLAQIPDVIDVRRHI